MAGLDGGGPQGLTPHGEGLRVVLTQPPSWEVELPYLAASALQIDASESLKVAPGSTELSTAFRALMNVDPSTLGMDRRAHVVAAVREMAVNWGILEHPAAGVPGGAA